jgi:DNA polymerase-3 subunit epsilon
VTDNQKSNDSDQWVILDTETDGLNYPIHALEIAAQRMRGRFKDGEPFRAFLNHQIPIPAVATAIHGYTEEFLAKHGIPPSEAYQQLRCYIEDRNVVAHYLRYDWNAVLLPEWRRLHIPQIGRQGFCTWHLSKRVIPECSSHSLDVLRERFGLPTAGAHSAVGDIDSVYRLLEQVIFPRLEKIGFVDFPNVARFSRETPLLKCHCLIDGRNYLDEVRKKQEERKELKARQELINAIQTGWMPDVPGLLRSRGLITEDPEIQFQGRTFLFTGKMVSLR